MIKIGITGGIGSGKSVVAELFTLHQIPVYIADTESKKLTATSPIIREQLIRLLGPEIYKDGELNKQLLASHIFSNPETLKQVNAIIHPEVNRHFLAWCEQEQKAIVATESAILFESGFNALVDIRLMVYAPYETRIQRAMLRGNVLREDVVKRINNQMDDDTKKLLSDYVIYNDEQQALIPQVDKFLSSLF